MRPEQAERLDRLLDLLDGAPHIFSQSEINELQRLIALRKQLDKLGDDADAALIYSVTFMLRLKALGWFGRVAVYCLAGAAAIISQWDKIASVLK